MSRSKVKPGKLLRLGAWALVLWPDMTRVPSTPDGRSTRRIRPQKQSATRDVRRHRQPWAPSSSDSARRFAAINFIADDHHDVRPWHGSWFKDAALWALLVSHDRESVRVLYDPGSNDHLCFLLADQARARLLRHLRPALGGDPVFDPSPSTNPFIALKPCDFPDSVWGHHMFSRINRRSASLLFQRAIFQCSRSRPPFITVFNWLATMCQGSIWLASPTDLTRSRPIFLSAIGGLTGMFWARPASAIPPP